MVYQTTASLDKLICTDNVDNGKCLVKFPQVLCTESDPNFTEGKLKFFKGDDERQFGLAQKVTMWESEFSCFETTKSAIRCSGKPLQTEKRFCASDPEIFERYAWTAQAASQKNLRCELHKREHLYDSAA